MTKILSVTLGLGLWLASLGMSQAQGTVAVYNQSTQYEIFTNTLGGVSGPTAAFTPNKYYYAMLIAPYGGAAPSGNPLDLAWTFSGSMATNSLAAGSISGAGGANGAAVSGWPAPTGASYDTGTEKYFMLTGWSADLGTDWNSVKSQLTTGNWVAPGYFGTSAVGYAYAGGGPNSLPAVDIFSVTPGAPGGLTQGFTLNQVPEPGSLALAGLGGALLLLCRRRK